MTDQLLACKHSLTANFLFRVPQLPLRVPLLPLHVPLLLLRAYDT